MVYYKKKNFPSQKGNLSISKHETSLLKKQPSMSEILFSKILFDFLFTSKDS